MPSLLSIFGFDERTKLTKLSNRGDINSSFQLALLLLEMKRDGGLSNDDLEEAKELLTKSSNAGIIDAAYELGRRFYDHKWLRHAARNGHIKASLDLARNQVNRHSDLDNLEKSEIFALVIGARSAGNSTANNYIQDMYFLEFGCSFDPIEYFKSLNEASQHSLIKIRIAWCHVFGIGTEVSISKARSLFQEIQAADRVEPFTGCDTLEPNLWLYPREHRRYDLIRSVVANTAKYMVKYFDGADEFLGALDRKQPEANFLLYLSMSHDQIPQIGFDRDELLKSAVDAHFPPAMIKLAKTLPDSDYSKELIREACYKGYVPAQIIFAKMLSNPVEKAVWKTLIFAQESFYGFRMEVNCRQLDTDMEDFVLRGAGFTSRDSGGIVLYDQIGEGDTEKFYEVLTETYNKYVKPFKPVTTEEINNAVFNVTRHR